MDTGQVLEALIRRSGVIDGRERRIKDSTSGVSIGDWWHVFRTIWETAK